MQRRYWFADPEKLKEKYLMALPFLSLEDIEVQLYNNRRQKTFNRIRNSNE
jgi:hypothetical protein